MNLRYVEREVTREILVRDGITAELWGGTPVYTKETRIVWVLQEQVREIDPLEPQTYTVHWEDVPLEKEETQ